MPMSSRARTLDQVNRAISKQIDPRVTLVKGAGYFYIHSDDDEMGNKIAGLYTSSIPVCHLNHQTVQTWVNDVRDILERTED